MAREDFISLRMSSEERQFLKDLAQKLERNESDTLRLAIRSLARRVDELAKKPAPDIYLKTSDIAS